MHGYHQKGGTKARKSCDCFYGPVWEWLRLLCSYSVAQNPDTWLQLQGRLGNVVLLDAQEDNKMRFSAHPALSLPRTGGGGGQGEALAVF